MVVRNVIEHQTLVTLPRSASVRQAAELMATQKVGSVLIVEGGKLHGKWYLVRMHRRPNESKDNWLLMKANDEWARGAKDADVLEEMPLSVVSATFQAFLAARNPNPIGMVSNGQNTGILNSAALRTNATSAGIPRRRSTSEHAPECGRSRP